MVILDATKHTQHKRGHIRQVALDKCRTSNTQTFENRPHVMRERVSGLPHVHLEGGEPRLDSRIGDHIVELLAV